MYGTDDVYRYIVIQHHTGTQTCLLLSLHSDTFLNSRYRIHDQIVLRSRHNPSETRHKSGRRSQLRLCLENKGEDQRSKPIQPPWSIPTSRYCWRTSCRLLQIQQVLRMLSDNWCYRWTRCRRCPTCRSLPLSCKVVCKWEQWTPVPLDLWRTLQPTVLTTRTESQQRPSSLPSQ